MFVDNFLNWIQSHPEKATWAVTLGALLAYAITRYVVGHGFFLLTTRTRNKWDEILVTHMRTHRLAWVAPLLVLFSFSSVWGPNQNLVRTWSLLFIVWIVVLTVNSVLNAVNIIYESRATYSGLAIQGYLDIVKFLFLTVGGILTASILTGQSPVLLLSGIGAASAVLLLIFQDTILDLAASIQIALNDLVKEGDWIEVPDYDADGEVINISLNAIKIQNWDMTFTVIPTHKLNETSYKNWRGMSMSGGRRIKRSLNLDMQSIHFCTPKEIEHLKQVELMRDFVQKQGWISNGSQPVVTKKIGARQTNVGAFISYVDAYLRQRDDLRKDMTILVYQLDPMPYGLPIEIYCYSTVMDWEPFELSQGEIFDHILASLPDFGLRVRQYGGELDLDSD